jgi:hypothetical protein
MCGLHAIEPRSQTGLAIICQTPPIGFDGIDQLVLDLVPDVILDSGARATIREQLNALAIEGGRGPAARRLLAREVVLARVALRLREVFATHEIVKLGRGRGDLKKVELFERLVGGAHKRLDSATDRLARLDMAQAPRIRVTANAAQFNLGAPQ